ncbi:MAG TPA: hypothetical protein EYN91_15925 [Candidatus Melainabacteria bacterium]|nr:hypothetical protein [Candidatus Melainabacteria bacterium]HIN63753.1 hypothetical protein [Candidatus Obscuribacterales bacterium]
MFRLGTYTREKQKHFLGASEAIVRQSMLMQPGEFKENFESFNETRHCLDGLGKPTWFRDSTRKNTLVYLPFNLFKFPWFECYAEPVVFAMKEKGRMDLFINPDISLLFRLEKVQDDHDSWYDPHNGKEVLRKEVINGNEVAFEIRCSYLARYLTIRQMALIVGCFRSLEVLDPSESVIHKVETGKVALGSASEGSKALVESFANVRSNRRDQAIAKRWLNLWFEIEPKEVDVDDPLSDEPGFDIFSMTLPTRSGNIAPGRFTDFKGKKKGNFKGCDGSDMETVYFSQEVLHKYQETVGFEVDNEGNVFCRREWGLSGSTQLIGNELVCTWIGDFATGVLIEEWPHWKQYSVVPPSADTMSIVANEIPLPKLIKALCDALCSLNRDIKGFSEAFGILDCEPFWQGSEDSIIAKQLKWVYPNSYGDEQFVKRMTFLSNLVTEEFQSNPITAVLSKFESRLTQKDKKTMTSPRNLLLRMTLIAALIEKFDCSNSEVADLIMDMERFQEKKEVSLEEDLKKLYLDIYDKFSVLAFLHDFRNFAEIAHKACEGKAREAAVKLGLPTSGWKRRNFIDVVSKITERANEIGTILEYASGVHRERSWRKQQDKKRDANSRRAQEKE